MCWFGTFTYCNKIATITLANITSHGYHFFFVVTFKILSLSNFEVYKTLLLTIITMLCIRSPGLNHLLTVCTLWPTSPQSIPTLWTNSILCFYGFSIFRFHIQMISYSICLSLSDLSCLTWHQTSEGWGQANLLTNISQGSNCATECWTVGWQRNPRFCPKEHIFSAGTISGAKSRFRSFTLFLRE